MDKEWLALEAERLAKDPVFLEVINRIRKESTDGLVTVDATDMRAVVTLQVFARVCDLFPQELEAMIKSGKERKLKTVV